MLMIEFDTQGRFVSWTAASLAFLGYSEQELTSMNVLAIVKEEQARPVFESLKKRPDVVEGGTYDLSIKKKNGSWIDVRVTPQPVLGRDGKLISIKCFFTT